MEDRSYYSQSDNAEFRLVLPGTLGYREALELQLELHSEVKQGKLGGALVVLEHPPVITKGVGTHAENLLVPESVLSANGVEIVETDRGGDATYHGPGQIVGYPIVNLRARGNDVHAFLCLLESIIISTLADYNLEGERHGLAGVWVGDKKICSIGIAVRGGVTYHGFSFNVSPNMAHFGFINPCGLDAQQITCLSRLIDPAPGIDEVRERVIKKFFEHFGIK